MTSKIWRKSIFIFLVVGAIQFIIITSICMLLYPGGTLANPNVSGYSFFSNYFSDLGRTKALSGEYNTISFIMFTMTLATYGISYILYFVAFPHFFKKKRIEKVFSIIASCLGVISGTFLVGIAFTPVDILPSEHFFFVLCAFPIALIAAFFYSIVFFLNKEFPKVNALIGLVFAISMFAYILATLYGPSNNTPDGLIFRCTAQKIIVYIWDISLLIQGYNAWKFIKS